jgi:nitroreductase
MSPEETLDWLSSRRSIRVFSERPLTRETLERLLLAATSAPSSTNRQPWRFAVVTDKGLKQRLADAVRNRSEEMKAIIRRGHHAEDFGNYGDFFHEPLQTAAAVIVPQYRNYPDLIANLIASGGGDPNAYHTAASMQAELCSTSAAIMALLLQAHGEGIGACWMAGPMVARDEICGLLDISDPWNMVGAVALGYPGTELPAKRPRKPLDRVVTWFEATGATAPEVTQEKV